MKLIEKVYIKTDIEGFELNTLKGTENLIIEHKPELSMCLYHKCEDIFDIPKYLKSIVTEYNLILRCGQHIESCASVHRY